MQSIYSTSTLILSLDWHRAFHRIYPLPINRVLLCFESKPKCKAISSDGSGTVISGVLYEEKKVLYRDHVRLSVADLVSATEPSVGFSRNAVQEFHENPYKSSLQYVQRVWVSFKFGTVTVTVTVNTLLMGANFRPHFIRWPSDVSENWRNGSARHAV
jgi:hypothetical protein